MWIQPEILLHLHKANQNAQFETHTIQNKGNWLTGKKDFELRGQLSVYPELGTNSLGPVHTGRGSPCNKHTQIMEHTVANGSVHTGCTQH